MARDAYIGSDQAKTVLLTNIQGDLIELFANLDEVVAARDGESSLLDQINAIQADIVTVTTEVTNARDGESVLLDQINDIQGDIDDIETEILNARDGEATLVAQINDIQGDIDDIETEILNARDGEATLVAQINDIQGDIDDIETEILNARDGESTLIDQINDIQANIISLANYELPNQDTHAGEFLTTNGTVSSWAANLPTMSGHSGEFLTNNGSAASWAEVDVDGGATESSQATDITLIATSTRVQSVEFTVSGKSVILPDATTLAEGGPIFIISNVGSEQVNVTDDGDNLLVVLEFGQTVSLYLYDNSTSNGSWLYTPADVINYSWDDEIVLNAVDITVSSSWVRSAHDGAGNHCIVYVENTNDYLSAMVIDIDGSITTAHTVLNAEATTYPDVTYNDGVFIIAYGVAGTGIKALTVNTSLVVQTAAATLEAQATGSLLVAGIGTTSNNITGVSWVDSTNDTHYIKTINKTLVEQTAKTAVPGSLTTNNTTGCVSIVLNNDDFMLLTQVAGTYEVYVAVVNEDLTTVTSSTKIIDHDSVSFDGKIAQNSNGLVCLCYPNATDYLHLLTMNAAGTIQTVDHIPYGMDEKWNEPSIFALSDDSFAITGYIVPRITGEFPSDIGFVRVNETCSIINREKNIGESANVAYQYGIVEGLEFAALGCNEDNYLNFVKVNI